MVGDRRRNRSGYSGMSTRIAGKSKPPDRVVKPQHDASDPTVSAWASANAGSGKTHVLTQRVIKLLLRGEDPAKILCITFTKAAAATMATRVFNTLSAWTALDDADLDQAIRDIGVAPDEKLRTRARRLFALALETPGGLEGSDHPRLLHQPAASVSVRGRCRRGLRGAGRCHPVADAGDAHARCDARGRGAARFRDRACPGRCDQGRGRPDLP